MLCLKKNIAYEILPGGGGGGGKGAKPLVALK